MTGGGQVLRQSGVGNQNNHSLLLLFNNYPTAQALPLFRR